MYLFNDFNQFHSMQAHNISTSHLELPLGHLMALCCSIYRHYCYGKHSLRIAPRMVCTARVGQPRRSSGPRGCRFTLRRLSPLRTMLTEQIGSEWWLTYRWLWWACFCLSIAWTSAVWLAASFPIQSSVLYARKAGRFRFTSANCIITSHGAYEITSECCFLLRAEQAERKYVSIA